MTTAYHDLTAIDRDEVITAIGELLAGLQVPLSLGVPLGAATAPYRLLLGIGSGFGYRAADEFAANLRTILDPSTHPVPGYGPAVHKVNLAGDTVTIYVDELYVDRSDAEDVAVALAEKLGLPLDDTAGLVSTNYVPRKVRQ